MTDIPDIHLRVIYDFEYETKERRKIRIIRGEKLFLLNRTNSDWWQVIRNSSERPFYVPASYVAEINKFEAVSNDKRHGYTEKTLECPLVNIPEINISPETILKKETASLDRQLDDDTINGNECGVSVVISDSEDVECSVSCHDGCKGNSCEVICNEVLQKSGKDNFCHDSDQLKYSAVSRNVNTNSVCDVLEEKWSRSEYADSGISSTCKLEEIKDSDIHPSDTSAESEKIKTSSSFDKLLQKFKFIYTHRHKEIGSECNPAANETRETLFQGDREMRTYPREGHTHGKNKLSYSRSFETRREVKNISIRKHRKSHLSSSWEGKGISDSSLKHSIAQPKSGECSIEFFKKSSCQLNAREIDSRHHDEAIGIDLISNQDSEPMFVKNTTNTLVPLAFHNSLYVLSHPNDVSVQSVESTESLDGYLDEDGVSDSGASFKSSEWMYACNKKYNSRNTIYEDVTCSSCDDLDNCVTVPSGWRKSYDEGSGEPCYINEVSQAKWFSSTDHEGRVYFFEENSIESSWALPKISVHQSEVSPKKSLPEVPADTLLRVKEGEKRSSSRITKARSLLVTDKKQRDSSSKSSSIPRNFLLDKSCIVKEGPLNRTKITENGKKIRKNWAVAHVVLREQFLVFYKDAKSVQPEACVELSEVVLESGDKMSKRKNVFLISTTGLQVLCQTDDSQLACDWCSAITGAIENLNKSSNKLLTPHSGDKGERCSPLVRSRSLRSKNHDGTTEDQASSNEEQTKIRNRLKRFFNRRPTRETLASKGIYKDEPVFDNHLEKVCSLDHPRIPKFVQLCISAIEGREENMKTDGLYRASGNLSHVQKIRLEVDQNNLQVLEKEEDVHVLTGALKLFFRELKEPLIPFELFTTALETVNSDKKVKIRMFQEIVQQLPVPNRDTLAFLLRHLRKVTEYEEYNRMHIPNLAIVFGPTLIWREKECHQNMALEYMQQNLVIEFFLLQFDEIFKNFKLPNS